MRCVYEKRQPEKDCGAGSYFCYTMNVLLQGNLPILLPHAMTAALIEQMKMSCVFSYAPK